MLTIKLPYHSTGADRLIIQELQKQYSPMIRTAYNHAMEGMKEKEIRSHLKDKFGQSCSWLLQSCVYEGIGMATVDKNTKRTKRIFGSKKGLIARTLGKLSKEAWKESRLLPLPAIGEACFKGNRKFDFDIIDNNSLIFKVNRKTKLNLTLPHLRKKLKNQLINLELAAKSSALPISIKISHQFIFISYDELKLNIFNQIKEIKKIPERHSGIDLNPNYIGYSISERDSIISTGLYDLKKITKKSGLPSSHPRSIYANNKLDFETIQIAEDIVKQLIHYRVHTLSIENLKFDQGNKGLGTGFNRLTNNVWKRTLFVNQLLKRCALAGIVVIKIHPAYTSFIGNLQHEYPDPISASLEISRRGYETKGRKSVKFYPEFKIKEGLANLWKKELDSELLKSINSWIEFYTLIKNAKLKYRVPIPDIGFRNLSTYKSSVDKMNTLIYNNDI